MFINIVITDDPSIPTFCKNVMKHDRCMVHQCIEELKRNPKPNSLVLGKIVQVLSFSPEQEIYILLIKQILPNFEYGIKFKAILKGRQAKELTELSPQTGDRVAFYEPAIFYDPGFEPAQSKIKKYLLVCETKEESSFWFAKKQSGVGVKMGGKSDEDKSCKVGTTDVKIQHRMPTGHRDLGKTKNPVNTKPLNPVYTYKSINSIKSADPNKCEKVNFFGVIDEIIKPPTLTNNNKYHMMFKLVDDSDDNIKLHVFLTEDQIIKQSSNGDILRLHRAKLETFNNDTDARIFFSQDLVLFKGDRPVSEPLTTAKNTLIPDEEKRRVETLKKWYEAEYISGKPTLLSDVNQPKKYILFCKVLRCQRQRNHTLKITVSDGSTITTLYPSFPLEELIGTIGQPDHIATEIIVHNSLDKYSHLKVNNYVVFPEVLAVANEIDMLQLEIRSNTSPQIVDEKTPQVAEIKRRIEEYLEKNLPQDTPYSCSIEHEKPTLPRTRQQRNKENSTTTKNDAKPGATRSVNRSSEKPTTGVCNKDDCETRHSESDPGSKLRKPLFTPNYMTDLSDAATEDTSENDLVLSKHKSTIPHEDLVNPASTNFNDIMEKVKTKYCSQKKEGQPSSSPLQNEVGVAGQCSSKKSEDCSNLGKNRKRVLSEECDSEAETVLNISLQQRAKIQTRNENKKVRKESVSTVERNLGNDVDEDDVIIDFKTRESKVRDWLNNPENEIPAVSQNDNANEFRTDIIKQIIGLGNDSQEESCLLTSEMFRVQGFLLDVRPDPSKNPLDLVSGFCHAGCQKMFLFSAVVLSPDESVPLCPECSQLELEKETELMFMMELDILELSGNHLTVLVMRHQAEKFLNCTVREFTKDKLVRTSRSQILTDFTLRNTYRSPFTPLLDICIVYHGFKGNSKSAMPVLVDSTLKLPSI